MRFQVAGMRDHQNLRIELRSGEQVLHTAYPQNQPDAFSPVTWDLRAHAGKMARVAVIDASTAAGMVVDQFELLDENLPPLKDRPDFGTMALVLLDPAAAAQALPSVQGDLAAGAAPVAAEASRPFDQVQVGALTAPFRLQAGETTHFTFAIAWHFPNFELTDWGKLQGKGRWYGTQFASVSAVVDKLASSGLGLVSEIDLWRKTYYDSTLPNTPILFGQGYEHWASIDGQCGIILRTYRTHLLGTDTSCVKNYWPKIRLATEWLLAQDSDGDGLPDLLTHHTLDEDISGPGPWISSLNLAALTAVWAAA